MPEYVQDMSARLLPRYPVEIRRIEWLTGRVANLVLHGPALSEFQPAGPGSHIKLILPSAGERETPRPLRYDGMRPMFAEGVTPPFLRTYMPLRYDADKMQLEVEMIWHGRSPASDWLRTARKGNRIIVAGPRGGWNPPDDGDRYLVMADDTGIPAAGQVIDSLKSRPCDVFFEVEDGSERRPLQGVSDALPKWMFRRPDGRQRQPGALLEEAARGVGIPDGRVYVWMALEAGAMRRIRRYLLEEVGLYPEQMVTRGYWRLGTADHPDGDYGED